MKLPIVHLPGFYLCSNCGQAVLGDLNGEHDCNLTVDQVLEMIDIDKMKYQPIQKRRGAWPAYQGQGRSKKRRP